MNQPIISTLGYEDKTMVLFKGLNNSNSPNDAILSKGIKLSSPRNRVSKLFRNVRNEIDDLPMSFEKDTTSLPVGMWMERFNSRHMLLRLQCMCRFKGRVIIRSLSSTITWEFLQPMHVQMVVIKVDNTIALFLRNCHEIFDVCTKPRCLNRSKSLISENELIYHTSLRSKSG